MSNTQLLMNSHSVIRDLLDKLWEMGGYTVGEKEFESYDVVINAREQLKELEENFKIDI